MTGLPFVWAFWSGPAGRTGADVIELLQQTAERGMRHTDEIADAYCGDDDLRRVIARAYLEQNLMFRMDERALAGLRRYYDEAFALGLAPRDRELRFF
jgi:predicted solute-binding protein